MPRAPRTQRRPLPVKEMLARAEAARKLSYSPYSKFRVGACVLTAGGRFYAGTNVENASYPLSGCAERNAVSSAVSAGDRDLLAIAVVTDSAEPVAPCGGCRQILAEFNADLVVVMGAPSGRTRRTTLGKLLPDQFVHP